MGLGLSLGNEVGKNEGQSSYILTNENFSITAGSGTLSNATPEGFTFSTSGLSNINVSTSINVPALTPGTLTAEYRYSFDITERTGDLLSTRSEVGGSGLTFGWGNSYYKSNYDSGALNLYVGGDESVAGNFTEGGSGLFVAKHAHSSWPTSLSFLFQWSGAPATRTLTISNFKVEQFILSIS